MTSRQRAPRLATLAKQINREFPDLVATVERVHCNTDVYPKGVHWRIPKKGRDGNELVVRRRDAEPVGHPYYRHNAAATYRHNGEVVEWIAAERRRRAKS